MLFTIIVIPLKRNGYSGGIAGVNGAKTRTNVISLREQNSEQKKRKWINEYKGLTCLPVGIILVNKDGRIQYDTGNAMITKERPIANCSNVIIGVVLHQECVGEQPGVTCFL